MERQSLVISSAFYRIAGHPKLVPFAHSSFLHLLAELYKYYHFKFGPWGKQKKQNKKTRYIILKELKFLTEKWLVVTTGKELG